ncbi:MAG: IPT/TIG domain-containing protein, partial [Nitrospira sp.]
MDEPVQDRVETFVCRPGSPFQKTRKIWSLALIVIALGGSGVPPGFGASSLPITLQPEYATPGATLSLTGKGFGSFKSVQVNHVTINGVPALVQRWEPDLIEVKVPFNTTSGPVEVVAGKKKLLAGTLTIVQPHIESITPTETERGALLQITGRHFGRTAGSRDSNTMFGVNDVVIGGGVVRPRQWTDDRIEVEIPANAMSGDVVVRLASSDPLPDGSCCAPVEHV